MKADFCVVGFLSESLYDIGMDVVSHSTDKKRIFRLDFDDFDTFIFIHLRASIIKIQIMT